MPCDDIEERKRRVQIKNVVPSELLIDLHKTMTRITHSHGASNCTAVTDQVNMPACSHCVISTLVDSIIKGY